jgi:predicted glycoside hydrolase/deacetylase ChbG (UPF0249 family)
MVFMEDSERAAGIGREAGIDAGLHLNFTTEFSKPDPKHPGLLEHQQKLGKYLRRHRFAPIFFHHGLKDSFEYVVGAQLAEYRRLYGTNPRRIDGHHHMHLCANVLSGKLLPEGIILRRNFSFAAGEKSSFNRMYRKYVDGKLVKRYQLVDFLFNLQPLDPKDRVQRIFSLSQGAIVELETHPSNPDEFAYLTSREFLTHKGSIPVASEFCLPNPNILRKV